MEVNRFPSAEDTRLRVSRMATQMAMTVPPPSSFLAGFELALVVGKRDPEFAEYLLEVLCTHGIAPGAGEDAVAFLHRCAAIRHNQTTRLLCQLHAPSMVDGSEN